jgi:hypothetical protein
MIKHMIEILTGCLKRGESVTLHQLIWTVDAKHHAIPSLAELNQALKSVPGFKIARSKTSVILEPNTNSTLDSLIENDIIISMEKYKIKFS